jgi:hypothetical protein
LLNNLVDKFGFLFTILVTNNLFKKKITINNKIKSIIINLSREKGKTSYSSIKKVKQIEKTHLISDGKVRLKSKQFQIA